MIELPQRVATTLKALRTERSWSLDKAALETGVSKAMLGQIERGESSPTIATLWKIATGFNVPFSRFIADDASDQKPVKFHPSDAAIEVVTLFPYDKALGCEIFLIELLPGCEHLSQSHETGVIEHVFVVEGTLEVLVDGVWRLLAERESLRLQGDRPHGYRNVSARRAILHDIIHYPK